MLFEEDKHQLARVIHSLKTRIADKSKGRQLQSIENKLINGNPLSPTDRDVLAAVVQGLLGTPLPKVKSGATAADYLLVVPALRKHLARARMYRRARNMRRAFKSILPRL